MDWSSISIALNAGMKYASYGIIGLDIIFAIIIIFFERKNPKTVWAWLFLMIAIPIVGFLLYLLAGTTLNQRRMFRDKGIEELLENILHEQEIELEKTNSAELPEELVNYRGLVTYNMNASSAVLTENNDVTVFNDGNDKFNSLKKDLEAAEKFIDLQYYIIRNDELFDSIVDILERKAKAGVEVRVLADGIGSKDTPNRYWKKLREKGIKVAVFWPNWVGHINLHINYRNHRKIAVIDNKIGYVGGFNIGREYIDKEEKKFGHWRDTHLRIEGEAVPLLHGRFALDWAYTTRERLFYREDLWQIPEYKSDEKTYIQIVSSGADSEREQIKDNYMYMISHAKKSLYIQSPYLIPDESILNSIKLAARSGVDVKVMIPCKPDHPFVYWCTHSYAGELVDAGATLYKYEGGFLHAKGVIADEEVFSYGTANMDIRSFAYNFEVNAVVYDKNLAKDMAALFMEDVKNSSVMNLEDYNKRPVWVRFKEQICRLVAPIL